MKCPECKQNLRAIPPCSGEWICITEDCQLYGMELYGITQKEVDEFVARVHPKEKEKTK